MVSNPFGLTYTGIMIEVSGAFIGVFSAIALGELVKAFEDYKIAERVRENLIGELTNIHGIIARSPDIEIELATHFWDAAKASGELSRMDRVVILYFAAVYNRIPGHNTLMLQCESIMNQPGMTQVQKQNLRNRILNSQKEISKKIEIILPKIKQKQIEDITGYFE